MDNSLHEDGWRLAQPWMMLCTTINVAMEHAIKKQRDVNNQPDKN